MKSINLTLRNLVFSHAVTLIIGCLLGYLVPAVGIHWYDAQRDLSQVQSQIQGDPNNADNWSSLGVIKSQAGDRDGAIEAYNAALKLDASNTTAYLGMGNLYYKDRDFTSAEKWYQGALEAAQKHKNPDDIATAQKLLQLAKARQE